jgi:hypothetical protein
MSDVLQALATALAPHLTLAQQAAYKAPVSSTPTTYYGHGPGGLFSSPALERPLFSAMMLPRQGVLSRIPAEPSRYDNPLYGIITGQTATTDAGDPAEAAMGVCDDPPVAGLLKLCTQTAYFGRQSRMSRVFELDRMGLLNDRGEHLDFEWVGNPFAPSGTGAQAPSVPGFAGGNAALNGEIGKGLFEMAVAWSRDFAQEFYTGNPANDSPAGGRRYYRGLDLLINTGYRDAYTGQACPAADSIVRSFGNANITTSTAAQRAIYLHITDIVRQIRWNAAQAGLTLDKLIIAMRPTLFYQLTEVWPDVYATTRTSVNVFTDSQPQNTSTEYLLTMRDRMRGNLDTYSGQFLMIDGQQVEVVLDDAIAETNVGGGTYRSSIYFIPLRAGGRNVLTLEYLSYTGARSFQEAAAAFGVGSFYNVTDNGRFAWHYKPPTNFCVQFLAKTEPRLILRTPYLAARLTSVDYTPISHERDWNPSGTYFVDGGVTDYNGIVPPAPSYFTPTA